MLGYAATNPTNAGAMLLTIIKTGPKKQFNSLSNRVYSPEHSPVSCLSKHIIATRPHTLEALEEKKSLRGVKKKKQANNSIPWYPSVHMLIITFCFLSAPTTYSESSSGVSQSSPTSAQPAMCRSPPNSPTCRKYRA